MTSEKYYLIGSKEGYNEIRFANVDDWQTVMGYSAKSIRQKYIPFPLERIYGENSKRKTFDISQTCDPFFTISKKALTFLERFLLQYGEILPIDAPYSDFVFFHCTNVIDALDIDKSGINWSDKEKGWIHNINPFVLNKNRTLDNQIFRLPNADFKYTFFGDEFKELVEKNKLKGIHFNRWEKIELI